MADNYFDKSVAPVGYIVVLLLLFLVAMIVFT
jgi:hypothetical protein